MIRVFLLLLPLTTFADTTGNLLPQQFFNNNQGHGGWNCNDPSHNHGNSIVAGVHGDFIENTITLGDTLNQSQINNGWTSTFGADMWGWNEYDQQIKMTQTITGADGTVTTQIRDVAIPGCSGYNCGSYSTYTDSYTQGINSQNDYTIKARFDFAESSQSTSHRAIDLKNPTLVVQHSLISVSQATELKTMSETVYNVVEDIEFYEYAPEEQFTFEVLEEPRIEFNMLEEINFEPIATEEINAGIIDVFMEMITYDNPETFEEIPTEIKAVEEIFETREENFEPQETYQPEERASSFQTSDTSGVTEPEPVREEVSERASGEVTPERTEEVTTEEPAREESSVVEAEPAAEPREEVAERTEEPVEPTVETETVVPESPQQDTVVVSIEDIREQVNQSTRSIDERLTQTSLLVAKAMQNQVALNTYSSVNDSIFNNQLQMDGGNLDEYNQISYIDNREIYDTISFKDQDLLARHDQRVTETVSNRIRAEENLRRIINGY